MKIATYARVSTTEQSNDAQRDELRAETARRGWHIVAEIEDIISGTKCTRSGLDHLMRLVRQHSINAVVCVRLDRIGRSIHHVLQLVSEFDAHRVALICTAQPIDTSESNPVGRLTLHILGALAEFERQLIVERTRAGLKAAVARGTKLGRPSCVLPDNAAEIVTAWRSEFGGKNYRELARRLHLKNPGTAFYVAKRLEVAA